MSFKENIGAFFYWLYDRVFDDNGEFVSKVEDNLQAARTGENVEQYIARSFGYGVIAGLIIWIIGILLGVLLIYVVGFDPASLVSGINLPESIVGFFRAIRIPLFLIILGIISGVIGFVGVFFSFVFIPKYKAGARKREINKMMPDAVSFMYALSVGGLNQIEVIESIARSNETYGEFSKEFHDIIIETQYFDTDYRTAIKKKADETPSKELSKFLIDMTSVLDSGGDLESFFEDKKEKYFDEFRQQQETTLETLELFGEMYMTLSLFPLLLVIIVVIMMMMGNASMMMLYMIVYGLLPMVGVAFLVLISTVKEDEIGSGGLKLQNQVRDTSKNTNPVRGKTLAEEYDREIFDKIKNKEETHLTKRILQEPHIFFKNNPTYTLFLTVPASIALVLISILQGYVEVSVDGFFNSPVWTTFIIVYLPVYLIFLPLSFFREWYIRDKMKVMDGLEDVLLKMSSANESGQTLAESMETVAESSRGRIAKEFHIMYEKINYGISVNRALIEFNNKYKIPRLARIIKLISKSQEASNKITKVLRTAAEATSIQDELERDRKARSRMQVVIIIMTYCTLLFIMALLKTQFIETMGSLSGGGGGGSSSSGLQMGDINTDALSLLFFHAVTIQAILSGFISGYMRDAKLLSGVKYSIILVTLALLTWVVVG